MVVTWLLLPGVVAVDRCLVILFVPEDQVDAVPRLGRSQGARQPRLPTYNVMGIRILIHLSVHQQDEKYFRLLRLYDIALLLLLKTARRLLEAFLEILSKQKKYHESRSTPDSCVNIMTLQCVSIQQKAVAITTTTLQ